jgi:hypothetical protein
MARRHPPARRGLYGRTLTFGLTGPDDKTLIADNQEFLLDPVNLARAFLQPHFRIA